MGADHNPSILFCQHATMPTLKVGLQTQIWSRSYMP